MFRAVLLVTVFSVASLSSSAIAGGRGGGGGQNAGHAPTNSPNMHGSGAGSGTGGGTPKSDNVRLGIRKAGGTNTNTVRWHQAPGLRE